MVLYVRLRDGTGARETENRTEGGGPAGNALAALHLLCAGISPAVEPDGLHGAFIGLGAGQDPERAVAQLAERAVPAPGRRLAAGAGANRLVAGAAARLLIAAGGGTGRRRGNLPAARAAEWRAGGSWEVLVVPPGQEAAFMGPLPVSFLWPAEPAVLSALERMGIATCGELAEVGEALLRRRFGETGYRLSRWARGDDLQPPPAFHPPAEVCERAVLDETGSGAPWAAARSALPRLAAALARRLQAAGLGCGELHLRVTPASGPPSGRGRPLPRPRNEAQALAAAAAALWQEMAGTQEPWGITAVELAAAVLVPLPAAQLDLWAPACRRRREALEQTLAGLRRRFAGDAVRPGGQLAAMRRERLLAHWDPYRGGFGATAGEEGAPWHGW